jgi:hypothetical protein
MSHIIDELMDEFQEKANEAFNKAQNKIIETKYDAKALRYNQGKVEWSLMHYGSMVPMIRVLEFGAKKYAPNNWKKGFERNDLLDCIQRHLAALMDGEEVDPESGQSHMAHIQCNAMFYNFHFVINKKSNE